MYPLPPAAHPLVVDSPWLPPVSFGEKPYRKLCRKFDKALKELEARYPTRLPPLTIEGRSQQLKRRPK
jgi:hypothetical protein